MEEDYGKIVIEKNLRYQRSFYHTASSLAQSMFYYVVGAGHFICHRNFHLYRYDYNNILIKYTLGGKGRLVYHDKTYTLQPHQLFIINCFDAQEYYTYESDFWENKWIHLNGCMAQEYFNLIYSNYGPVIDMPTDCRIPQYIDHILDMMESHDIHFEAKASADILQILTEVLVGAENSHAANSLDGRTSSIGTSIVFIENHYSEPITVEEMAAAANFSPYHFIRVFKRATGFTPYEYLLKYRINRSKVLLASTSAPISEIARETGFHNASSYIRTFRKFEEKTPMQYRILFREEQPS